MQAYQRCSLIPLLLVVVCCAGEGAGSGAVSASGCSSVTCEPDYVCIEGECYLRQPDYDLYNLPSPDAPKDYGDVMIQVLPPESSACTCSASPELQTEETLCGWHLGDALSFSVQAKHMVSWGEAPMARVRLSQAWPDESQGDLVIETNSTPGADDLFEFELQRSQLTLADPPDGEYWLRIEAVSTINGPDYAPMVGEFMLPIVVDTTGPIIEILTPTAGETIEGMVQLTLTAEEPLGSSGLMELTVLSLPEDAAAEQWEPVTIWSNGAPDNTTGIWSAEIDLTGFAGKEVTLRVQGTDCVENQAQVDVEVMIELPR